MIETRIKCAEDRAFNNDPSHLFRILSIKEGYKFAIKWKEVNR